MRLNNNRREFVGLLGVTLISSCAKINQDIGVDKNEHNELTDAFTELEKTSGGRLGICILDTQSGKYIGHRIDERFAMCSTFKLPLAAFVFNEINAGRLDKNLIVPLDPTGLKVYSPIVQAALKDGKINIVDAAKAAQISSDNIAANAILKHFGGPSFFTQKIRKIGDEITRLDAVEPMMNVFKNGDVENSTTPIAMAHSLDKILTKEYVGDEYYNLLTGWMKETQTGLKRLRAGLPVDWVVGDKTGTGINEGYPNRYNDVALAFTPEGKRVIITSYFESDKYYDDIRDADQDILKRAAEIAARFIKK